MRIPSSRSSYSLPAVGIRSWCSTGHGRKRRPAEGLCPRTGYAARNLPYWDGAFVQYGSEIRFYRDLDGDLEADEHRTSSKASVLRIRIYSRISLRAFRAARS